MPWQRRSVLGSALAAGGLAASGLQARRGALHQDRHRQRHRHLLSGGLADRQPALAAAGRARLRRGRRLRRAQPDPGGRGLQGLGRQCRRRSPPAGSRPASPRATSTHGAFSGTGVFAGQPPMTGLRALASLYLESVHLLVTKDSGIGAVADLRGKRVSLDVEGSGTLVDALLILAGFGLTAGGPAGGPRLARPLDRPDGGGRARRDVHGRRLSGGDRDRGGAGDRGAAGADHRRGRGRAAGASTAS